MDLTTAIKIVADDTRTEAPERTWTDAEAIASARDGGLDDQDLTVIADLMDATTRTAYAVVLDASDEEIADALS
ncbi:hypothetical protein [Kutzneria buriramensis]|uniref:Uncharacterized protein n=1 Tax=Kutzneria buriramensis TaxID=1045776 RepID=A0A3E0G3T0_9PSEU|nr:hypothetical protein [Kutzneria buriramensis]REH17444.1 hypothetical protein BCF44_14716 [Kutzneria buriramensis]